MYIPLVICNYFILYRYINSLGSLLRDSDLHGLGWGLSILEASQVIFLCSQD